MAALIDQILHEDIALNQPGDFLDEFPHKGCPFFLFRLYGHIFEKRGTSFNN